LLGITDFFNLLFLGLGNFIGESVKDRKHGLVFTDWRFAEFRVGNFLSHFVIVDINKV